MRKRFPPVVLLLLLSAWTAGAGEIDEFNATEAAAWDRCRNALYQSSPEISDEKATESALVSFNAAWRDLRVRWGTRPPPHYVEDPDFRDTLARISETGEQALALIQKKQIAETQAVLQQIPFFLGEMRRRNGLTSFADQVDDFRELLAEINSARFDTFELTPPQVVDMLKTIGALSYLRERIEKRAPQSLIEDSGFLEKTEEINVLLQGLTLAVLKGQRAPILDALHNLRYSFQTFHLLYG